MKLDDHKEQQFRCVWEPETGIEVWSPIPIDKEDEE